MKRLEEIAQQLAKQEVAKKEKFNAEYVGYRNITEKSLRYLIDAMFPGYTDRPERSSKEMHHHYLEMAIDCLAQAFGFIMDKDEAEQKAMQLAEQLPEIYEALQSDMIAAYEGDPAAKSVDEIILAYPAFWAISTYRIAHRIYLMGIPQVARIMTEYAHRKTGIDIHPGATIGRHFFIDHGTGVVVGETTTIGDNVKLYQHVTLGAKSFDVAPDGSLVKGIKRHPDIGNNVVIYSGATILGGDVSIGDGCVIGGNVWLTHSVPAGETVYQHKE